MLAKTTGITFRLLTAVSLVFCAVACTGPQTRTLPTEVDLVEQESILKQLYLGQPKESVLEVLGSSKSITISSDIFQVLENRKIHLYLEAFASKTRVSFGFYFEDDLLLSLLVIDPDVDAAYACRSLLKTKIHWLNYGIKPYADWFKSRNELVDSFDYRVHNSWQFSEGKSPGQLTEEALTFGIYAPFFVIAAPFYLIDAGLGDGVDRKKMFEERRRTAESISIGMTERDVVSRLGPQDMTDYVQNQKVLTFNDVSFSFAFNKDKVVWIESMSMFEWFTRQNADDARFFENIDCGSLEQLWKN